MQSQTALIDALNTAALKSAFADEGASFVSTFSGCVIPLLNDGSSALYTPMRRDAYGRWFGAARVSSDVASLIEQWKPAGIALGIEPGGPVAVRCDAHRSPFENAPYFAKPETLAIRNSDGTVTYFFADISDLPRTPRLVDGFELVSDWQPLPITPSYAWITSPATCAVLPRLPFHLIKG